MKGKGGPFFKGSPLPFALLINGMNGTVVSRKKRGFSAHFGPDGAVLPPRVFTFFKGETL